MKTFATYKPDGPVMAYDDDARKCMKRYSEDAIRGGAYCGLSVMSWAITNTVNGATRKEPYYDLERAIQCLDAQDRDPVDW